MEQIYPTQFSPYVLTTTFVRVKHNAYQFRSKKRKQASWVEKVQVQCVVWLFSGRILQKRLQSITVLRYNSNVLCQLLLDSEVKVKHFNIWLLNICLVCAWITILSPLPLQYMFLILKTLEFSATQHFRKQYKIKHTMAFEKLHILKWLWERSILYIMTF